MLDTNKHVEPTKLDLYLISREKLTPEQITAIERHLARCRTCQRYVEKLTAFYDEIESRAGEEPSDTDRALAKRILGGETRKRALLPSSALTRYEGDAIDAYAEVIEPYPRSLPQRFVWYVRSHPVQSVGGFSMAAALVLLMFSTFKPLKDMNPAFAKVKDYVLSVYNKEGEVLWRKQIVGMPDGVTEKPFYIDNSQRRGVLIADINNDANNEVLLSGFRENNRFADDTLYCFDSKGDLRWHRGVGSSVAFGTKEFTANARWKIIDFFTLRDHRSHETHLYVLAHNNPYFPTKLLELEATSERELQTYWHPGHLSHSIQFDIDGDGDEEIVLAGVNNSYRGACISVLDPSRLNGFAPSTPDFAPAGIDKASEMYYVVLPFTDLGQKLSSGFYNAVKALRLISKDKFQVITQEITATGIPTAGILVIEKNFQ